MAAYSENRRSPEMAPHGRKIPLRSLHCQLTEHAGYRSRQAGGGPSEGVPTSGLGHDARWWSL